MLTGLGLSILWPRFLVAALAILPNDLTMLDHRMGAVLEVPEIRAHMGETPGEILVHFMPTDYVMQGMIADTGGEWQLYKRHHTFAMIGDWIFHPFRHLEGGTPRCITEPRRGRKVIRLALVW